MMKTQNITIELPSDILLTLNENEKELKQDIKISLALRLYQLEKLTIGKAAQIAGLSRLEFDSVLVRNGISVSNLSNEDVFNDIQKLK
jgi:predicted HTH domain antitoxin